MWVLSGKNNPLPEQRPTGAHQALGRKRIDAKPEQQREAGEAGIDMPAEEGINPGSLATVRRA